jgi:signal transduction histidine kinase/ABC-type amino acid transport substrate-binding protein
MRKFVLIIAIIGFTSIFCNEIINIGYYNNPPKIYHNETSNKPAGLWADITNEIFQDEGYYINWVLADWPVNYENLKNGTIDILVDVAELEKRKDYFDFNQEVIITGWSVVYISKSMDFVSLEDFSNRRIGVLKNSMNYKHSGGIEDIMRDFDIHCDFVEFTSYQEVLDSVEQGSIDGGVCSKDFGDYYALSHDIKPSPFWFQPLNMKYALNKSSTFSKHLISIIDSSIYEMKTQHNSVYYKSLKKYITHEKTDFIPIWLRIVVAALFTIVIIAYIFNRLLLIQVKNQTEFLNTQIEQINNQNNELKSAKEELMNTANFKDNVLRAVSHELRTPLNAILGFSHLIKSNETPTDDKIEFNDIIISSSKKLLKIVNNLIEASQLNNGIQEIQKSEVKIAGLLEKKFAEYNLIADNSVKLKKCIAVNSDITLTTDQVKLEKILDQLLDNAFKFTDKGSIILGACLNGSNIVIYVQDTGIGVAERDQQYLFVSFTQLDAVHSRKYGGTGLGLTIAKALTIALGGNLIIESKVGVGSKFSIIFKQD